MEIRQYGQEAIWFVHIKKDDQQPWLAVDLQNVYGVNVINIYGRTDGMYYFFFIFFQKKRRILKR